jgi:hypothetical protein
MIVLTPTERDWLRRFCPSLQAGPEHPSCLERELPTLCQACFTHGSIRALMGPNTLARAIEREMAEMPKCQNAYVLTGGEAITAPYMAACPVCNNGTDERSPRNCARVVAPSPFRCPHCEHTTTFYFLGEVVSCGRCGLWSNQDGTIPRCNKESNVGRCVSKMYHTTDCTFTRTVPLAEGGA